MVKIWARRRQRNTPVAKTERPIIETKSGPVRGFQVPLGNDCFVNAFLGIPYAEPPIGELRFQKPQKRTPWLEVRNCFQHGPCAPQRFSLLEKLYLPPITKSSEDCLYLNVFAPAWKPSRNQPNGFAVMIFIHGGAFGVHSSSYYGDTNICRHLCSKDVIIVTIQYRLGIFGFGTTGEISYPPNLGLWDQAQALDWVKTNIASFGGNPENITIFGQSAGAASADLLSLSPHTRDLFDKVIAVGGSANCYWVLNRISDVREALMHVACKLGWKAPTSRNDSDINSNLLEFLRKQPAGKLAIGLKTSLQRNVATRIAQKLEFTPVIDGDFLPEPISELRKKAPRKICITGTTEYEGLMLTLLAFVRYDQKAFSNLIRALLPDASPELLNGAISLYLKNDMESKKQYRKAFVKLYGDIIINNGVHSYAQEMTNAGHCVYLYNFDYHPPSFGVVDMLIPFIGATHGTELPYLFGKPIIQKYKFLSSDFCLLNNFTTLVTNFAKYGTPYLRNHQIWKPLTTLNPWAYLNINETCTMRKNFQDCRSAFWNNLEGRLASKAVVPMVLM